MALRHWSPPLLPFLSLLSVPLAIAAVIMGIVALVRNRKRPAEERRTWMSIVGMILGIATGVLLIVLGTLVFNVIMNSPEFEECMNKDSQDAIQQCFEDLGKNARDTQNA